MEENRRDELQPQASLILRLKMADLKQNLASKNDRSLDFAPQLSYRTANQNLTEHCLVRRKASKFFSNASHQKKFENH